MLILLQNYYRICISNKGGSSVFNKKFQKALAGSMAAVAMATAVLPVGVTGNVKAAEQEGLQLTKIEFDQASPQVQGTSITISAQCTGAIGELSYTYRVLLPNGNYETIAKESSNEYVNYTLSEVGIYNFIVEVSDGKSYCYDQVEYVSTPSKVSLDRFKFDKSSYAKNDKVKITIGATPAEGTVKSKVVVKTPAGKKTTVKGYSTKMTASYKVKKKGTYKFTVSVKDNKTSVSKTKSIKVK